MSILGDRHPETNLSSHPGSTTAQCKSWALAYAARRQGDRERVLKHVRDATRGYVGTTDMPTLDFLPELLELYPEARVVLVGRDPERWARSVAVIGRNVTLWWLPYLLWPVPGWRWFPGLIDEIKDSAIRLLGDGDTTSECYPCPPFIYKRPKTIHIPSSRRCFARTTSHSLTSLC